MVWYAVGYTCAQLAVTPCESMYSTFPRFYGADDRRLWIVGALGIPYCKQYFPLTSAGIASDSPNGKYPKIIMKVANVDTDFFFG